MRTVLTGCKMDEVVADAEILSVLPEEGIES
jgi:hypothetical protein